MTRMPTVNRGETDQGNYSAFDRIGVRAGKQTFHFSKGEKAPKDEDESGDGRFIDEAKFDRHGRLWKRGGL